MDSFGLTVREVQALAKDGNCVRVVRQKLLVEHNDVAAQHDLMTPEERMGLARRSIKDVQITTALRLLREAIRAGNATEGTSSRRYMGRTPTESLHLTNEMRSCALSALSLKDSAFNERLKLVLLYEEDFTRLMEIFAAAREHARQNQSAAETVSEARRRPRRQGGFGLAATVLHFSGKRNLEAFRRDVLRNAGPSSPT